MRTVAMVVIFAIAAGAQILSPAQQERLLLPDEQHVSGFVVDPGGAPIPDAWVYHLGGRAAAKTDAEGRFDLTTRVPRVVIRKPGYESYALDTQLAKDVKLILRPISRNLPMCSRPDSCHSLHGGFCFPNVKGVKAHTPNSDSDYVAESFTVGKNGIQHGSGYAWSFGIPFDEHVWAATNYRENSYMRIGLGGLVGIVDARGKSPKGTYWRYLGYFSESASYDDVNRATAELLDEVLDGVCLLPLKK
jgi:hypothetical protein